MNKDYINKNDHTEILLDLTLSFVIKAGDNICNKIRICWERNMQLLDHLGASSVSEH